jgi:hypothetical protein
MSRQRGKQRRNQARRPWWRPLVGLGLLAGWLAVTKRGRQAVKAAKEQASKARQKLAAARPGGTTMVAPPTGAPPGPVLAQVTKLPQDNDGGDEKPEPKSDTAKDTETRTATAEPPTNPVAQRHRTGTPRRRWDGTHRLGSRRGYRASPKISCPGGRRDG